MKTIFITIFQGVEARNIVRTSILKNILKDPNIRVVLFAKTRERVEHYKKELDLLESKKRIFYEVVEEQKPKGLDRMFSFLKFVLLKTATTDLQRRMVFEVKKHYFRYYFGLGFNFLMANFFARRIVRFLDFHLVKDPAFGQFFERYKPDLLLTLHLFGDFETNFLREAKRRKVKSLGLIYSWDKATSRCVLRLLPDKTIVFNDNVKAEMIKYQGVAEKDIFVSGVPTYDIYFNQPMGASREEFCRKIKIDTLKRIIVFGTMGRSFSDSDWEMIDYLRGLKIDKKIPEGVEFLVRFLPYEELNKKELAKRPDLIYDYPGIRFSGKRLDGMEWDMGFEEIGHLRDTLRHMAMLVCYASSLSIEASVLDKPVINLNFELKKNESLMRSPTQYFATEHYKKALDTGGIRLVNSKDELTNWINRYLDDPSLDREGRRRLMQSQCKFTDGRAGERIAEFILKTLSKN